MTYLFNQYGLNFGGRFDFCLNYDGNSTMANTNFAPTTGGDLALFTLNLEVGDYYSINFDVSKNGTPYPEDNGVIGNVSSNQQAIIKQGIALKWAIYEVLQKTGRDKVILMGHSMGGLAAREYLQNPVNWQADGTHHVAKLVTSGTPHGGSNSSSFGLGVAEVNERMDATRDLRRFYKTSEEKGVYLFGGIENNSVINNTIFNYYNVDVNCNGVAGDNITGLNQKNIYNDLDYSCIIGECSGCIDPNSGDGIVWDFSADLKNYYPGLTVNRFYYFASAFVQIHTDLPDQYFENMQGLDEPNRASLAYNIELNKTYTGFITIQPTIGSSTFDDYDIYKFTIANNNNINLNINNITLADLKLQIVDVNGNIVGNTYHSNGANNINFSQYLNSGIYYLAIYGTPTTTSYLYPYNFALGIKTGISDITSEAKFSVYPNPANDLITIKVNHAERLIDSSYAIYDNLGRQVLKGEITSEVTSVNIGQLKKGVYVLKVGEQNGKTFKVVKL